VIRSTVARVDLAALQANFRAIQEFVNPRDASHRTGELSHLAPPPAAQPR